MANHPAKAPKLDSKPRLSLGARIARQLKQNWVLYLMIIPVLAYFIVYCYAPHCACRRLFCCK